MEEKTPEKQTEEPITEPRMTWKERIWETFKLFIVPIAIVLLVRIYIAQPFIVKGASMEPNFEDREYLIIDEVTPALKGLQRGMVIVFHYPLDPSEFFIKRVIGLPGEHLMIKEGSVKVSDADGKELVLNEEYLPRGTFTTGDIDATVPNDQYFVMGDNRNFSSDSRRWGFLPKNLVTGRVMVRLWPLEKIGIIQKASYTE
ncbi:MAG: signal peptidase I [Patescibacteria group bacterium]